MSSSDRYQEEPASASASRSAGAAAPRQPSTKPVFMQAGDGQLTESAMRLQAILAGGDRDSGYGGSSLADDEAFNNPWHPDASADRYTPDFTARPGEPHANHSEHDRRILASNASHLHYNQNRTVLARAINSVVETLKTLQKTNAQWPAHYPTVQKPRPQLLERGEGRPALVHTQSTLDGRRDEEAAPVRPSPLRRAGTSLGEQTTAGSSEAAEISEPPAPVPEPRLLSPQLSRDFSVLKIELKMEGLPQSEIVHSLEKQSVAALLDNQINNSIRHLFALRDRIEDTSSKVLITGDLNAGKSTFCNALLRRKILPEDQQPCTSIFCEVLDVRENGGIEEVHAIPHGSTYDRKDESTYEVFQLKELENIVGNSDDYAMCKIYVGDVRPVDQSLLNNGVVDIALIDAPGLNSNSIQTTALFARQEEIDVVVFVVSAANHFTQSAREFILSAAREKAYMFMVVNGFDNIRDKERCKQQILKQVAFMSPATFKESSELVHFVSSNAIPAAPASGPPGGSGSGGAGAASASGGRGSDDPKDDPDDDASERKHGEPGSPPDPKGKGKQKEAMEDFGDLESSLRRFVLEKRARSKLAPAKTYLLNLLSDLNTLATVNQEVAQNELNRVADELAQLEPVYEKSKRARSEADEGAANNIDETANDVYELTRNSLTDAISRVADADLGVPYPGLLGAYDYAEDLKAAMLNQITETVRWCEERAREKSVSGVSGIKQLGLLHLGDEYTELTFRPELMFRSRRDALTRQVDFETEIWDFFDFSNIFEKQEKITGTSMAVTVAGVVGGRALGFAWVDTALTATKVVGSNGLRRLFVPGLILAGKL